MTNWTQEREAEAQMWANLHIGDIAGAGMYLPDALDEIKRLRDQLISAWPHTAFTCPCSDRLAESAPLDKCDCGLTKALYAPEGGGA